MVKKVGRLLLILIGIGLLYYLFFRPYDVRARWEEDVLPGTLNQLVKAWDQSLSSAQTITQGQDFTQLTQLLKYEDSLHRYRWTFKQLTDSSSQVTLLVKDQKHSLANRFKIPFAQTPLELRTIENIKILRKDVQEYTSKTRVRILGEDELPSTFYAYIPVAAKQSQKADMMMRDQSYLSQFLLKNKIQLNGLPFVRVTEWDQENDSIFFEFAYPIVRSERLPQHPEIKYRRLFAQKVLKAEYNGNYVTSERAWYALQAYAENKGLDYDNTPIEFFFNNPNMGGDGLNWKAEVFLPLKQEEVDD